MGILRHRRKAFRVGAFIPTDIANLHVWYDAFEGVEEADGDPAEDGDNVLNWLDQSSNVFDSTQSQESQRPNFVAADPSVDFENSTSDGLEAPSSSGSLKPVTVFAVVEVESATTSTIWGPSANGGMQVRMTSGTTLSILKRGVTNIASATNTVTVGNLALVGITYDASGNFALHVNDETADTGTNDQSITGSLVGVVGRCGNSPFEGMDGKIRELVVYSSVVSGADISNLKDYFNDKWTIY